MHHRGSESRSGGWNCAQPGMRRAALFCAAVLGLSVSGCMTGSVGFQVRGRAALSGNPFAAVTAYRKTRSTERVAMPERAAPREERTTTEPSISRPLGAIVRASASNKEPEKSEGNACYQALRRSNVRFTRLSRGEARGVEYPIQLAGPVDGIKIRTLGEADAPVGYLDCRLAKALLAWAPTLRKNGVREVVHYSIYRKGAKIAGTQKTSSHANGMAIDAARFRLRSGKIISVLDDWKDQTRGADPCAVRPRESANARLMRRVVCDAAARNVFQVIITPHYNRAHHNHVHLEIAERGRSTWIR
jgi:hypothetical protein